MSNALVSKDFIFKDDGGGGLHFIGDFDGLYESDINPWGQDGSDDRMGEYYRHSRDNILHILNSKYSNRKTLLEIGCGLGYVVNYFSAKSGFQCSGADISSIAINKAKEKYNNYDFYCFDIQEKALNTEVTGKYDIVILNQVLWYVLENFNIVFNNVEKLLNSNGVFVISNAFTNEQRYGKDIVDGFGGLVQYVQNKQKDKFGLKYASLYADSSMMYGDGIVVSEILGLSKT